ncbi:MAG: flagellar biosynthesis protein FlhB [Desulfovibrionaceae bacterium]|jgi:flagellar biosynthetic protein FlhB|nr:flagellar biosynthesis protein FlhB [Desulfovibrionaceae bacterium]
MPQTDPSKTEKPTQKRLDKARRDGNVPKSQELPKATVVLAGLVALWAYIGYISKDLMGLMQWFLTSSSTFTPSKQAVYELFVMSSVSIAKMTLPVLLFLGLVAFVTLYLQVGQLWTTKTMEPKFSKFLNPLPGLQRMFFSVQTWIRLGKSVLQAGAIGIAPYIVLTNEMHNMPPLFYSNATELARYMLVTGAKMVVYALVPMLLISLADLLYTRWDYTENLKMTKDEVKDERKQAEGDPKIKAKQKEKMLGVMMKRMMADVPKADVVITNPTHFAVALKYDAARAPAPVVLAKGMDHVALRIKEIAREAGVPIKENKPLARALYSSVEIGEMIPEELYQAVAATLAQLSKFKRNPGAA